MKKYEIRRKYKQCGHCIEGSTKYETIEELIKAYKIKGKNSMKTVCLTCEYINSLNYKDRAEIKKKEYIKLKKQFDKNNIADKFINTMWRLYNE